jgi:hypothetical protein
MRCMKDQDLVGTSKGITEWAVEKERLCRLSNGCKVSPVAKFFERFFSSGLQASASYVTASDNIQQ